MRCEKQISVYIRTITAFCLAQNVMLIDSIFTGRPESRPPLLTLSLSPLFLSFLFLSPSFPSGSKVEKGNIRTRILYIVFLPYRDSKKKKGRKVRSCIDLHRSLLHRYRKRRLMDDDGNSSGRIRKTRDKKVNIFRNDR